MKLLISVAQKCILFPRYYPIIWIKNIFVFTLYYIRARRQIASEFHLLHSRRNRLIYICREGAISSVKGSVGSTPRLAIKHPSEAIIAPLSVQSFGSV